MNAKQMKGGTTMSVSTMLRSRPTRRALALTAVLSLGGITASMLPVAHAASPSVAAAMTAAVPTATPTPVHTLNPSAPPVCTVSGPDVTCDLWAKEGTMTLPNGAGSAAIWSFVSATGDPVTAPVGPTLVVTEGQIVHLVLHNSLPAPDGNVSLSVPQAEGLGVDTDGVASSQSKEYTFAPRAGTYIYQAGETAQGARQAAMGLVGALVVESSTPGTAYGTGTTGFTDEHVVVLSDLDTGLSANPLTYDMRGFYPEYRLMNGKAFPVTSADYLNVAADSTTLLRVINAGAIQNAIGVLGVDQMKVVGLSSRELDKHPYYVAAENVSAGDTTDFLVTIPPGDNMLYAIYDPTNRMDNNGALDTDKTVLFGGALNFLQVGTGGSATGNATPTVSGLSVAPTRVGPAGGLTFNATATDTDGTVQAVEYFVDNATTPAGNGTAATITPGATVTIANQAVAAASLSGLTAGTHKLFVRAQDNANAWGAATAVSFTYDNAGPKVTALAPAKTAVNGSASLGITGSATDVGGGTVASANYAIDGNGALALSLNPANASTTALTATIAQPTVNALAEGTHTLTAIATDDLGNAGLAGPTSGNTFIVDKTPPTVANVVVTPNPNDGTQGVSYDPTSIEVRSTFADPGVVTSASGVVGGEGFIDVAGGDGTGFPMVITQSTNPPTLVGTIPLSQINGLADGNHTILVHAQDKAGNWGATVGGSLVLTRAVTISGLSVSPTATAQTTALVGAAKASAGNTIVLVEYFIGQDPGLGLGTALTITTPNVNSTGFSGTVPDPVRAAATTAGNQVIYVRAKDSSGKWSPATPVSITLQGLFSNGFETGLGPWTTSNAQSAGTGSRSASASAALTGGQGLLVHVNNGGGSTLAYVATPTISPAVRGYHVGFQLRVPATGGLQTGTANANARWIAIERGMNGTNEVFRVEYRRVGTGTPQVRLIVAGSNTPVSTANVAAGATHTVKVDWLQGAPATVTFTVDGTPTSAPRNTGTRTVAASQFGISLVGGGGGAITGDLHLDAFTSSYFGLN